MHNRVVIDATGERVFTEATPELAMARLGQLLAEGRTAFIPLPVGAMAEDLGVAREALRLANQMLADANEENAELHDRCVALNGFNYNNIGRRKEAEDELRECQTELAAANERIAVLTAEVEAARTSAETPQSDPQAAE